MERMRKTGKWNMKGCKDEKAEDDEVKREKDDGYLALPNLGRRRRRRR